MTSLLLYPFRYLTLQLPLYLKLSCKKRVVTQTVSYEPNPILITSVYALPFLNFDLFFSAYFVAIYPFGKQVKDIKWPLWWISVIHIVEGKVLLHPILTYSLMLLLFSPLSHSPNFISNHFYDAEFEKVVIKNEMHFILN